MIFLNDILSAIPLGFFLSFMIGPVFFVLLETSVVKGFRAAVMFDLGVVLADVIFILIAFFSSYRLIQSIKDDPALFIFGGLVMLTYGIISFVKNKKESKKSIDEIDPKELAKTNYFSLFIKGFFPEFHQYRCTRILVGHPHYHWSATGIETIPDDYVFCNTNHCLLHY